MIDSVGAPQVIAAGQDPELIEMARADLPRAEADAVELLERVKGRLVTAEDRQVGSVNDGG